MSRLRFDRESLRSVNALMFDGWSNTTDHFIGVYITHTRDGAVAKHLIAPLLEETNMSAAKHKGFIEATLELLQLVKNGFV